MKISVIVPVYNVERYIARCLDSVITQNFDGYEIICVNDGATDKSGYILSEYAARNPSLIKLFEKENGGLSDARNFGLSKASGEYVLFLDSDDYLEKNALDLMYSEAKKGKCDVVSFDFSFVYDNGVIIPSSTSNMLSEEKDRDFITSSPMAWARLIKRELFAEKGFTKGIYYEDLDRIPCLAINAKKFGYVKKSLYCYYQRVGSIMNSAYSPKFLDIFKVLDNIYSAFEKENKLKKYKNEIEYLYIEHLFRSAAMRFVSLNNRKELFGKINSFVAEKFPDWKNNPYLKKRGAKFRLVVFLSSHKLYFPLKCLMKLKGQ